MEWQWLLLLILGGMVLLMATGMPIVISLFTIVILGAYLLFGGIVGLEQVILSVYTTLTSFVLLPIPLFVLMGELMVHSGIALNVIDVLNKWMGRIPGRLGLLTVAAGTILSVLTGSSMASVAILGTVLVPEMEKRGYHKHMILGPILGSGGLAMMVPPSAMAIILCSIGQISVGKTLIAIIVPGLLMAFFYTSYIVIACMLRPSLAPSYDIAKVPWREKLVGFVKYVLPTGVIIFLVIGLILLGMATPSESAASGTIGMVALIAAYNRLKWDVIKKSLVGTLTVTGMVLVIIASANAFSQILSFSGATQGLTEYATGLPFHRIILVIIMQVIILMMGCFMDPVAILMITLPIFVPFIMSLGFSDVWFAVITLLNIEMAMTTPPFGLCLFVMKGVTKKNVSMADIYLGAAPYLGCDALTMGLLLAFPGIPLWLVGFMH
ncbi:MAG: TRAP transporter large permease subunit [Deltaproteobacteria bacterium]|nr:TRAP transporter large permease subunit [Deltaproteobacteria bacterium]